MLRLLVLVAALGFMNAPYAQTAPLFPDTVKPKPEPRSKPHSKPHSTPPQRTHIEPRPRPPRASTPERPVAVQAQPGKSAASPPVRDVTLSRCDELRRRMEQAMRDEARSGDQRRAIYQEQLRAGCI